MGGRNIFGKLTTKRRNIVTQLIVKFYVHRFRNSYIILDCDRHRIWLQFTSLAWMRCDTSHWLQCISKFYIIYCYAVRTLFFCDFVVIIAIKVVNISKYLTFISQTSLLALDEFGLGRFYTFINQHLPGTVKIPTSGTIDYLSVQLARIYSKK